MSMPHLRSGGRAPLPALFIGRPRSIHATLCSVFLLTICLAMPVFAGTLGIGRAGASISFTYGMPEGSGISFSAESGESLPSLFDLAGNARQDASLPYYREVTNPARWGEHLMKPLADVAKIPRLAASLAPERGGVTLPSFGQRALRFEIIAVGTFPIMFFYTNLGFGIGGYIASGFNAQYAPWPFSSSSSTIDDSERLIRIAVGAGLSCAVAIFDLFSTLAKEKARRSVELDSPASSH